MPKKLHWVRHCILHSHEQRSIEYYGLVLFADGTLVCPPRVGFLRGEEIVNHQAGDLVLRRQQDCDLIRLEQRSTGQVHWLEFEMGVCTRWHHVFPAGPVGAGDEPSPLRQKSEFSSLLQRCLIAFGCGLSGDPPPNF